MMREMIAKINLISSPPLNFDLIGWQNMDLAYIEKGLYMPGHTSYGSKRGPHNAQFDHLFILKIWQWHITLFYSISKERSINDRWDLERNQVICTVDTNMAMDNDHNDIRYKEAMKYVLEAQKHQAANN